MTNEEKTKKLNELLQLKKELFTEEFYILEMVPSNIIGYQDAPDTLLGHIPIHEHVYTIKKIKGFMMNNSNYIFATYEEAKEKADYLTNVLHFEKNNEVSYEFR